MKASDYIVEFFISKGITDVFGYPGGMVTHLMDSFHLYKDKIKAHLNYHEQAAAFAACGYAQCSNRTGVVYATSGPGATNLITGICNSYFDSIPVIFITGQVNTNEQKKGLSIRQRGFQETDIVSIVKTVTKYSICLDNADDIPKELEKAYTIANSGRKGPVLIDIPMNLFRSDICDNSLILTDSYKALLVNDIFPFETIKRSLLNATAPVLLVGAGVKSSNNVKRIRNIVSKFKIPAVSSMIAFDALSGNPYFYGFIGAYGSRVANFIIAKSDLIISIGSRMDIRQVGVNRKNFAPNAKIIRFDIDYNEFQYKVHEDELQFRIEINHILDGFEQINCFSKYDSWINVCNEIKNLLSDVDANKSDELMSKLNRLIKNNSIITTDVGQNQVWVAQSLKTNRTQNVLFSGSFGAMGYSLPAAIGAYYGSENKAVFCITGDGGMQMNIQELQFVVREKLPIKIIVINNKSLGMIRHFQEMYFNSNYFQTKTYWGYSSPDFAKIANAYGIKSTKLSFDSIDSFNWNDGPELIEIEIDEDTYVTPKLEFGKENQDQNPLIERDLYRKIMKLNPLNSTNYSVHRGGVTLYSNTRAALISLNNLRSVA